MKVTYLVLLSWGLQLASPFAELKRAQAADEFFSSQQSNSATDVLPQMSGLNQTPDLFRTEAVKNQGELFRNCDGGLQSAVTQGVNDITKAASQIANGDFSGGTAVKQGFGVDAVCPGSAEAPATDSLSCALLAPGGVLDKSALQGKLAGIDASLQNIACNKGKLASARAELSCLSAQANLLAAQIKSMEGIYSSNINRMKGDVTKIDGIIADRETQQQEVIDRLGGQEKDGGNGSKGLLAVQKELELAVNDPGAGLPKQIQGFKDRNRVLKVHRKQIEDGVANRKMGLAAECFAKRTESNYTCTPPGKRSAKPVPVSMKDYAVCRYTQDQSVGVRGRQETGGALDDAEAAGAKLSALLNQIMADTPQKITPSKDGAPVDAGPPAAIMTAADVETKYGAELDKFQIKGYDLKKVIMGRFNYCYDSAAASVEKERVKSSALYDQQKKVDEEEENLKTDQHTALNSRTQLWSKAMTALTANHSPLYPSKCGNADATLQTACLEDLKKNLEGLLQGNTKDSAIVMSVRGKSAETNINFSCGGINGCIIKLQNIHQNLKTEKARLVTFKKSYVDQAKASTLDFNKKMSAMMSTQNANLQKKILQIKNAVAGLGGGSFDIPGVQKEEPKFDENGLPVQPSSILNLIGGAMEPPMIDIKGDSLNGAITAIGKSESDWGGKAKPLNEARSALIAKGNACAAETSTKLTEKLSRTTETLANCGYDEQFCRSQDSLTRVIDSVDQLDGGALNYDRGDLESSLNSGMKTCESWYVKGNPAATKEKREALVKGGYITGGGGVGCSQISTRLQRDLKNIGRASGASGSASGGAR